MLTRTYNLRTCTDAGIIEQLRIHPTTDNRSQAPVVLTRDLPPHVSNLTCDTDSAVALYSDMVASRPPSPRKETRNEALEAQSTVYNCFENGVLIENNIELNVVDTSCVKQRQVPLDHRSAQMCEKL